MSNTELYTKVWDEINELKTQPGGLQTGSDSILFLCAQIYVTTLIFFSNNFQCLLNFLLDFLNFDKNSKFF